MELTLSQQAILGTLRDHGPMTSGELAGRENVSAPTITRAVDRLEEADLISRSKLEADRRSTILTITRNGVERLEWVRSRRNAWLAVRLAELRDDDLSRLQSAVAVIETLAESSASTSGRSRD